MELEFDKEIDAILRKAQRGTGVTAVTSSHIDADTIAAFAENALPDRAKLLYMEHFTDCGRCRKQLSHAILTRTEADATAAFSSIPTPVIAAPWYSSLFRTGNLAMAMGALVLTFGGVLGYLVLQNRQAESNATVSQVTEREPIQGGPYVGDETLAPDAAPGNNTVPAANSAANTISKNGGLAAQESDITVGRADSSATAKSSPYPADDEKLVAPKPAAAAPPPPPVTLDGVLGGVRAEKKTDADKAKEDQPKDLSVADSTTRGRDAERRMTREAAPAPSKSGPVRSGPVQNQNTQINTGVFDMTVTRIVGGKTFSNRDGVWYDSRYRGQATTNIRRGTDEYNKLESGLRSIANNLSGVVVTVWKGKAYRIN